MSGAGVFRVGPISNRRMVADWMRSHSTRFLLLATVLALVAAGCPVYVPRAGGPALRVLFMGNSYTYVNDLPHMFEALAASGGRNVVTTTDASAGELLQGHASDPHALALLDQPGWNFVVLQEQSQVPAVE